MNIKYYINKTGPSYNAYVKVEGGLTYAIRKEPTLGRARLRARRMVRDIEAGRLVSGLEKTTGGAS
jgi:hypothetical protein